jgi:hypothetical protein
VGCRRSFALALSVVLGSACAKEIHDPRSADVDFGDPKSVVASVFFAAEHGSAAHLAGLCDPTGAASPAARRVCAAHPGAPDWGSFRRAFARGRLNGEPRVHGDHARLDFVFGPAGDESETMELVRRGGRWYLSAF